MALYTRYLARGALDGVLPPAIQWRTTKEPFSPDYFLRCWPFPTSSPIFSAPCLRSLLLGALMLSLLPLLQRLAFKNRFANSLAGMFIGAPLGVCVNCVTPIAQGVFASGSTRRPWPCTVAAGFSPPARTSRRNAMPG